MGKGVVRAHRTIDSAGTQDSVSVHKNIKCRQLGKGVVKGADSWVFMHSNINNWLTTYALHLTHWSHVWLWQAKNSIHTHTHTHTHTCTHTPHT